MVRYDYNRILEIKPYGISKVGARSLARCWLLPLSAQPLAGTCVCTQGLTATHILRTVLGTGSVSPLGKPQVPQVRQ